jgi:hypothetical protein
VYIRNALILESGPLADLEVEFDFNDEGTPKPMVIVGRNGAGKSNFLSIVTDALIEIAAKKFTDVAPRHVNGSHEWHRSVGGGTMRTGSAFELAILKFSEGEAVHTYLSKGGQIGKAEIQARLSAFPEVPDWSTSGSLKSVTGPDASIEKIFRQNCYVSFPTGRSEAPYWSSKTDHTDNSSFIDQFKNLLKKPIQAQSSLSEMKPWLVDVLLDQMIDAFQIVQDPEGSKAAIVSAVSQHATLTNINMLLRLVLNEPNARLVRAGRQAGNRKLKVSDGQKIILPSLDSFSSGQAMLFGIFGTILRYADAGHNVVPMAEMKGIVLVDEVDMHLHADLQHEILPKLMLLFPKIQFIVSAHSPLFTLGMETHFGSDHFMLLDLPTGTRITAERFSEFLSSFEYLQKTKSFDEMVTAHAKQLQRALVLCEGQTDPKYLKTAAELLGFSDLIENVDIDWIGVLSNGQAKDGGVGQLRQAQKTLQNNPTLIKAHTVLLFDCDQNDLELDDGLLHVRVLPKNEDNVRCDKGIENLLPAETLEERFFSERTKRDGANVTVITALNKSELCDFLCDEKRDPADFVKFRLTLEALRLALNV